MTGNKNENPERKGIKGTYSISRQEKGSRVREKVVEKFRKLKFLAGFEKPGKKEINFLK